MINRHGVPIQLARNHLTRTGASLKVIFNSDEWRNVTIEHLFARAQKELDQGTGWSAVEDLGCLALMLEKRDEHAKVAQVGMLTASKAVDLPKGYDEYLRDRVDRYNDCVKFCSRVTENEETK